eukprot:TRINITY_DN3148_c0_g1_i3.p2 TRINITY_DN3148_c0_g1~~TRINITY_DN3148_c0_g1_i3.p2  ORF type:complete len:153 (-),score=31.92 TRINITY_DN3148_c0_g1_i3:30-488(-)
MWRGLEKLLFRHDAQASHAQTVVAAHVQTVVAAHVATCTEEEEWACLPQHVVLQVFFYTGAHGVQMFDVCHGWRVAIMSSMADISDTARAGYRQGCTSVDQLWFKLHVELSSMLPEEERRQEMQWIFYPKRPEPSKVHIKKILLRLRGLGAV